MIDVSGCNVEDIVSVTLLFASDKAVYITGQQFFVYGGLIVAGSPQAFAKI